MLLILFCYEGPQLPKKIRALASYRDYTFAAYGNDIAVVKRAHQVWALRLCFSYNLKCIDLILGLAESTLILYYFICFLAYFIEICCLCSCNCNGRGVLFSVAL